MPLNKIEAFNKIVMLLNENKFNQETDVNDPATVTVMIANLIKEKQSILKILTNKKHTYNAPNDEEEENRRLFPRFDTQIRCRLKLHQSDHIIESTISNLSISGAQITVSEADKKILPNGVYGRIFLLSDDGICITKVGFEVARTPSKGDQYGIKFTSMTEEMLTGVFQLFNEQKII